MKKFISHLIKFYLLPIGVVILFFRTPSSLFLNESKEIYDLVSKAISTDIKAKTILLGDSVCKQFYSETKNSDTYCLCENQSYEVPGNYLLLKGQIANNPDLKKVVLLINPVTLTSSLNQKYTYNYFMKPFSPLLGHLELNDRSYLNTLYPKENILTYKFSNFKLPDSLTNQTDVGNLTISKLNMKYIKKMDSLCNVNNVEFVFKSPPLPSNMKKDVERFDMNSKKSLSDYFSSIMYYDSILSSDGIHHKDAPTYIMKNKKSLDNLINKS
ncbi:hypothetical protein B0O79_2455 [Flavobacteriaceae bacterium MAR_2009_75]|nr:hypothetical protein B0O79_2455 [Flavobacteriaceae bacterium MAR_2009_75]